METLKTLKGSKIWYSKYGVGKQMGNKIYIHKDYALDVLPMDIWWKAQNILHEYDPDFEFNCICYDLYDPTVVRFDEAKGFDTEREPMVGITISVDTVGHSIYERHSSQIWHHKWLWVNDDYTGFDVEAAYDWSKTWLKYITNPSGYLHEWNEELRVHGLPVDNV